MILGSCKKDGEIIPNNNAPYYDGIPTTVVKNYINRVFIDLIGREPLDAEMENELNTLRAAELSATSRAVLVNKLQTDVNFIQGDSSYQYAYYIRFYQLSKARMLEGASDAQIQSEFIGILTSSIFADSVSGDSLSMEFGKHQRELLLDVIAIPNDYLMDSIEIADVYGRLLYNQVYDRINMNTFNFLRASFNDLFSRFPTQDEFTRGFDMVEYDKPEVLFGKPGQNKGDYVSILVNSKEFYEGMIIWLYQTLLAREPSTTEIYTQMIIFYVDHDVQRLQRSIMITDEYANFNWPILMIKSLIKNTVLLALGAALVLPISCKKEDDSYVVNSELILPASAFKTKLKTDQQYVAILHANLFQTALSANELYDIAKCMESIGDKEVAREVIISNFMNKPGVQIPTDSVMRLNIDFFIAETYERFLVREPSQAEITYFRNYILADPNVTPELVYFSFALSNEYLFY